MKAGELFVNLGIKGSDKAVESLKSVRENLKSITSTSLETKAGILGVMYALQQFTAQSNNVGMGLKQFENLTELSGDTLQRWQYIMRQVGVSTDETTNTISGLQKKLGELILSKSGIESLAAITNKIGAVDFERLKKGDAFYFLD